MSRLFMTARDRADLVEEAPRPRFGRLPHHRPEENPTHVARDVATLEPTGATLPTLRRAARAVLVALGLAFLLVVVTSSGSSTVSGRLGGDYPAFYGAGTIVADGDARDLYDPGRQQAAQEDLHGDEGPGYLAFAYPPFVAAAYAPLAALPYALSYVLHTALMVAALVGALRLLRPVLGLIDRHFEICVAASLAFYPLFRAVTAGQNTALTLLLVAWTWRSLHDERELPAGVALGLLLFKPQLALPLLALIAVRRHWVTVAAAGSVGGLLWGVGAALQGTGWVGPWWDQATAFGQMDAVVNGANAVSWLGVAEHLFGLGSPLATVLGWGLAAVTAVVVGAVWLLSPPERLTLPMATVVTGALLIAPHAMFYDGGLVVLVALGILSVADPAPRRTLIALFTIAPLHALNDLLGITPVFVVTLGAFAVAVTAQERVELPALRDLPERGPRRRLSVVIPAHDEERRIGATLDELVDALDGEDAEVIVVDDGSADRTAEVAARWSERLPHLRVLRLPNNVGKGGAVRAGMLVAHGDWRLMMDADGSTPMAELDRLREAATTSGADVVIASVAAPGAQVLRRQRGLRPVLGRIGNALIRLVVLPGIRDSQRGFKLFEGTAADDIFRRCRVDGWGFDVEVLAIARLRGHRVDEVGVRWEHRDDSRVRASSYATTLGELIEIRRRLGRRATTIVPTGGCTDAPQVASAAVA